MASLRTSISTKFIRTCWKLHDTLETIQTPAKQRNFTQPMYVFDDKYHSISIFIIKVLLRQRPDGYFRFSQCYIPCLQ